MWNNLNKFPAPCLKLEKNLWDVKRLLSPMIVSYGGSLKHDDPIVEEMRLKGQWCKQSYGVFSHTVQKVRLVPTLFSFYLVFDKCI